jgi:hypothetical protein
MRLGLIACAAFPTLGAQSRPPVTGGSPTSDSASAMPAYRLRIIGVYDDVSGRPIEGVEVRDLVSGLSALTTSTGTVSLLFLPDGGSLVRLRKLGYEAKTLQVSISPAETTPLTIPLRSATLLPTVNIRDSASHYLSPNLKGAEERMRSHAGGYFIDEAEMRKQDNSTLAMTLTSRIPAVMSTPGPHGETRLVSARQPCARIGGCPHPDCYIRVMLDGVPFSLPGGIDFSRMTTADYALVEFYPGPSTLPVEFGPGSACGVLLLWSRER